MGKFVSKLFSNKVFYNLILILVVWNIWSLPYSPIVWFDEVFMASMTNSFLHGNGFALGIASGEQILIYGPVYFLLTAFSFLIGGINSFSYRIVNLIFAFFTVFTLYQIMGKLKIKEVIKRLIVLMFLVDVIFVQNSHSGRMEFVAVYFTLLCLFYYLKDKITTMDYCLTALFSSLAFLTTPRVAVILFPILLFVLIRLIKEKKWYNIVLFLSIPTVSYLIWIFASYGSINAWIDYYMTASNNSTVSNVDRFMGGSFYIPKFQYPLIISAFITVVEKIRKQQFKIVLLFIIPIITYYLLVKDPSGLYSAYILAFLYAFLSMGLQENSHRKRLFKYSYYSLVCLCFLVNLGIFSFKVTTVISTIENRDQKALNVWVAENIKKNSNVVGSECYFYACKANHCSLGLLYPDCYFSNKIKPEYLLINKTALNDKRIVEGFAIFKSGFDLDHIASYTQELKDNIILRALVKVGIDVNSSYAGDLYEVKLKSD